MNRADNDIVQNEQPATRRKLLQLIAAAAVAPIIALNIPRSAMAAIGGQFDPPITPMLLSRTIVRELPDAAQIVVRRAWEVRFKPTATGFSVSGQQVSVEVEAPPALEFLAQLEEQRQETSLFPLMLSSAGMISSDGPETASDGDDAALLDLAIAEAAGRIEHSKASADAGGTARAFLSALQGSSTRLTSKVPRDLFRPQQSYWQNERTIELPQGLKGTVSVTFDARMNAAGELMERAERRVVSSIGGSSRTSSEVWELGHA